MNDSDYETRTLQVKLHKAYWQELELLVKEFNQDESKTCQPLLKDY